MNTIGEHSQRLKKEIKSLDEVEGQASWAQVNEEVRGAGGGGSQGHV